MSILDSETGEERVVTLGEISPASGGATETVAP